MDGQPNMSNEPNITSKVEDGGERGGSSPDQMRRELEEEFNVQRAKMKDLFLQKEEELRKLVQDKEQLQSEVLGLHAELQQLQTLSENQKSEIQSLQLLVNETVEASSSGTEEVRRLRAKNIELEQQMAHLRQQEVSIAPATFVRSLARKLGGDTDAEAPKKITDDNELLRSMLTPLEQEITALKNKLRETDAQLQEALKSKAGSASVGSSSGDTKTDTERSRACDMCVNYEKQLVAEQRQSEAARDRLATIDQALKLATEELEGVRSIHDETVRAWHSERASSTQQLEELRAAVDVAREALEAKAAAAEQASQRALEHVTMLTVDRETLQKKLDSLERDNAMLIGQYMKKAMEMQNEMIDLPDSIEELQEYALQLREQLIVVQVGRESALASEQELRAQLLDHAHQFRQQEALLADTNRALNDAREKLDKLKAERVQMREATDKLQKFTAMTEQLLNDKERLQGEISELRSRVSVLQQELDNSEKVQQDFVRLSQSLQVQLQRIREADTEVRWQHDDDVSECPSCHTPLPNNKKKVHCRHCGRIFCGACVRHAVASGPRRVPARVCSVCRTLLQPDTAPYFSTDPPHTPD